MRILGDGRFENVHSRLDGSKVLELPEGSRSANQKGSEVGLNGTGGGVAQRVRM